MAHVLFGASVLFFFCSLVPCPGQAYIYAHYSNMSSMLLEDLPALFGSALPKEGLMGVLVEARPQNACIPIDPPPTPPTPSDPNSTTRYIVLIRRYDCNFDIKVLHAQQAGFSAAIVHNMYSNSLLSMGYSNDTIANEIEIPSVFTSFYASEILHNFVIPEKDLIIIVMAVILIVRCVQHRKRLRKNRLSKEKLKKIPTHKFIKGDEYDVCAICLDEYEEGDELRVLPCSHAYHCRCVDPWLTQTKKTCPVCKQRVTRPDLERFNCSDSDDEAGTQEAEEDERTPLLHSSNPISPASTSPPPMYDSMVTSLPAVATVTTSAQCLAHTPMGNEDYYSPIEDSDEATEDDDEEEEGHHSDTTELIGRGALRD
ncbi:hypothetical protein DNTS_029982 [Danionella cerebrum]|uniref:RING-type E3 ubiquitin transferase n=1 Tax=Danionella cerebrum TaxID=2873325 RepID=A0A553QFP9_9TELE|nr:hypothetical protein DNTS_029982 [Danionella translucida]